MTTRSTRSTRSTQSTPSRSEHPVGRRRRRSLLLLIPFAFLVGVLFVSCGDDEASPATSAPETTEPATTAAPTTVTPTTVTPTTVAPTTVAPTTVAPTTVAPTTVAPTTTTPSGLEQPAIWPAADVVFTTPEDAARSFVEDLIGVPAVLGEFMAGDSRSGEIEVFSPGEGGPGSSVVRSLLLLRQLGPDDGWFVLAAVRPEVSIDEPASGSTVPAAPLTVRGAARGYEATILVSAFPAGTTDRIGDTVIASGGALETPEPYEAVVDLTDVPAGTVVTLLVRGDTGLETDPGEFSAIPVVIAG
ncbi:unannotated protein [freshwater metagenome]|uniref:Unannotated protein n=1 Tax=freshwater metagenome TaxID=449393 RepID=A0A6J6EDT6_9ZZZZ